jgi:hypothetical protein
MPTTFAVKKELADYFRFIRHDKKTEDIIQTRLAMAEKHSATKESKQAAYLLRDNARVERLLASLTDNPYANLNELAQSLGVHRNTLHNWLADEHTAITEQAPTVRWSPTYTGQGTAERLEERRLRGVRNRGESDEVYTVQGTYTLPQHVDDSRLTVRARWLVKVEHKRAMASAIKYTGKVVPLALAHPERVYRHEAASTELIGSTLVVTPIGKADILISE